MDTMIGPYFRYEEESLYPAVKEFLGDCVDSLIAEHDAAFDTAKTATKILAQSSLSKEEGKEVAKAARALLMRVSNCDGLNTLAERFSPEKFDELGERCTQSRAQGVPLLRWPDNYPG